MTPALRSDGSLVVGAPVALSGRYARQGQMAAAGIQQAIEDAVSAGGVRVGAARLKPELAVLDDQSSRAGVQHALDLLSRADLIIGPYGSDLVADAASWAQRSGRLVWNHGASADVVQREPYLVSVPSPASEYLSSVLESLAIRMPAARVLIAAGMGSFGRSVASGAIDAAAVLGMKVIGDISHAEVPDDPDTDILLAAGSFSDDVELVRRLKTRPPVVAAVAAGLGEFGEELGVDGVLGPSQWEEGARFHPDVGTQPADAVRALRARLIPRQRARHSLSEVDYPAAQAYAAVLIALHCVEQAGGCDDSDLDAAARQLRCTTFFGRFGLGEDRLQKDHQMLVIEWRDHTKRVVWPPSLAQGEVISKP